MSDSVSLQKRINQLRKAQADLPKILYEVQTKAATKAVEAATEATPPKGGRGQSGANTLSGELQAHWDEDSVKEPRIVGNSLVSELNNNTEYASYVDQGHRMEKHFVPGLHIEGGALAMDPEKNVGLVVGTKTKYVKGEFMVEKAKEVYEETILKELDKAIEKVMQ